MALSMKRILEFLQETYEHIMGGKCSAKNSVKLQLSFLK
jgi:hypothetical protein